ncbi:MAG TPA: pseudouridine synthase [Casimicrobiaceae bacterium]
MADSLPPPKHKRSTDEIFSEPQRLHKVLAACGFGSRRAMEEMILAGRITVNRMPAEIGQKVGPGDEVRINGDMVKVRFTEPRPRVLMYHKPAGEIVTRDDPEGRATVFEKLPSIGNGKWINVGRLDYNTEGLLLFTNSGELANRLMHPRYEVAREYAVRVMGRLTDEQMNALTTGIELDDGVARCDAVEDGGGDEDASNHWYKVVLHEGRNREVRRLFEKLGVMVSRLIRTRYGPVAMPTVLKRSDMLELEAAAVSSVLESAGLQQKAGGPSAGGPPGRHRDSRGGSPQGRRPGGHGNVPQGQGGPRSAGPSGPRPPHGGARPHAKGPGGKPGFRPHGKGPRPQGQGQGQGPGQSQGQPRGYGQGQGYGQGHGALDSRTDGNGSTRAPGAHARPQRPKGNFDEVQPTSNANASPFATSRHSSPHGGSRGHDQPGAHPRFRGGPRAKGAGGNPQQRHARPPQKPRPEVNGNVAPRNEAPPPADDES